MIDIKCTETGDDADFTISGDLVIQNISQIAARLKESINSHNQLKICLEQVEQLDLAGLQLICSAHKTAMALNKKLSLEDNPNNNFKEAAKSAGFSKHFGCKLDESNCCFFE